jgi:IPT/TIG domain
MRSWVVAGTSVTLALVGALVLAGNALAEKGESDAPRAVKLAPHPPQLHVIPAAKHDKSRPLRDMAPVFPTTKRPHERENRVPPRTMVGVPPLGEDPVAQTSAPTAAMPASTTSFEGLGNVDGYVPPDTNGDVGPNNYVETVNAAFAVYDKSGTKLYGPADINTLWSGFGGLCQDTDDGDPVVQYDQLADRWVISQFAFALDGFGDPVGPYYQCVAVSTTSDPTGSYYRYAFLISNTKLDDYPKIGVWPDGYYMSVNEFDDSCGLCFAGVGAVAFDRASMLAGSAASLVYFDLDTNFYSMLPSDLDGSTSPPAGAPDRFVQFDDNAWGYVQDQLEIWNFHVDWTTPANSTFTSGVTLATASFDSNMCFYDRWCVHQPSPGEGLDAISDRLMYRLAYRHFSDHETMVVTHTVDVGSDRGGIRWYELRRTSGSFSIFQQGTYAPGDGNSRWMGSAAMDQNGNLAIGYSVSGGSTNPSIRYAGRLVGDPAGQLTQGEATLKVGGGVQTDGGSRWGDYSSLDVDPSDDCTFWYANEYYPSTSGWDWHTRIGAFKFPTCGPPPAITDFSPPNGSPGTSVTITGTHLDGATAVKFNGKTATFTVDSAVQIRTTVPSGATNGPISVVTPRGTATSSGSFLVGPSVSSFSPGSGLVGTVVTVNGTNITGATAVSFGGVAAAPTFVSATQVKAAVPVDAHTGQIGVTSPGGTGLSMASFKVLPKVTSFSPGSGAAGDSATIAGSGFTDVSAVKFNGVAAAGFTADSDHQITATVPAAATIGKLSVTTAGGTATSLTNFTVVPTITGFSPGAAAAGSPVTVDGTGFGGVTSVKVNGVSAGFATLSKVQLRLTVPAAASSGTITVTTAGGTATSAGTLSVLPKVTGFTPGSAAVGATVTISGNAFGGATSVLFNGVGAVPATVTPTKVTVVVPAAASTGKLTMVTGAGSGQSTGTFKVLPKLTSFSPGSGASGDSVTIAGSGFTDVSAVKFNGVVAGFGVDSDHQITATVPATATTGKVSVVTAGGTATSLTNFLAVPTITGFAPGSAPPGSTVTVDGTGFGGVTSVKVNGVAAGFSLPSKLQLRLTVPSTATSGTITVTTAGGTATSGSPLSVTPRVTGFTPSAALVGATVTISGNAFGGATNVLFNGVSTVPGTVIPTKITVPVPADASTGKLTVVTAAGAGQSAATFKVLPKLTSFSPGSGVVGTTVTISGTGFTDVTAVKFNGHAATTWTRDSSIQISAMVPLGATTGRITVTTAGGTATSATNFTVVP